MIFTLKQIYRLYFHINFQPFLQLKKWKCVGKIQLSTWVYFTWPVNVQMMKVREYFPNVTCHIRKRKAIICHINAVNTKSYNKVRSGERNAGLPSMFSIIFQCDGCTLWWKPNQTSRPPPSGCSQPSGGVKNDLANDICWPEYLHPVITSHHLNDKLCHHHYNHHQQQQPKDL